MYRILAAFEKGNRDRVLTMTPDFAEFLNATPDEPRTGPIFPLIGLRRQPNRQVCRCEGEHISRRQGEVRQCPRSPAVIRYPLGPTGNADHAATT